MDKITPLQLKERGRLIETPFLLEIEGTNKEIVCQKILRFIPDKRIVFRGEYEKQTVAIKLFISKSFKRHYKRELQGCLAFKHRGINTPELLVQHQANNYALLVFHWLSDAESLQDQWDKAESEQKRTDIVSRAIDLIAVLHQKGIDQADIHLNNFLVANDKIYAIDGDMVDASCIEKGLSLPQKKAVYNLAMFFTQFPPEQDEKIDQFLQLYRHHRKLNETDISLHGVQKKLMELRKWRERKFIQKKVLRNCSEFICKQGWRQKAVYRRSQISPELIALLKSPDSYLEESSSTTILKEGKSAIVLRVSINDKVFVLKKFKIKNKLHSLLRSLKSTRAEVSWKNGCLLGFLGISTPKPLALVEKRWGPFRTESYLITEHIKSKQLWAFFRDLEHTDQEKQDMLNEIKMLFSGLCRCKVSHGDLKMQNILVQDGRLLLIDLDGMRSFTNRSDFIRAFDKDVNRFIRSWDNAEKYKIFCDELRVIDKQILD